MSAWKRDGAGTPVVHVGNVTDVTSELPLVSIVAQVEVWDWVLQHLPQDDTITHNIRATARKAIENAYPCVMHGRIN